MVRNTRVKPPFLFDLQTPSAQRARSEDGVGAGAGVGRQDGGLPAGGGGGRGGVQRASGALLAPQGHHRRGDALSGELLLHLPCLPSPQTRRGELPQLGGTRALRHTRRRHAGKSTDSQPQLLALVLFNYLISFHSLE